MKQRYTLAVLVIVTLLLVAGVGFLYDPSNDLSNRVALLEERVAYLEGYLRPQPSEAVASACENPLDWTEAIDHIGEEKAVKGPVVSTFYDVSISGQPTFLNIGAPYPDPSRFIGLIWGQNRLNFPMPPEYLYKNRAVCVFGTIEDYKGIPEIEVTGSEQVQIMQD